MNFTPFGSPFTGTITGIHQFSATGSLVPSTTAHQDSTNRYNSGNVNMPHFSQPHTPILGKYRADESTSNAAMAKYNNQANQYSIPVYPQQTDQGDNNKQRVPTTSYTQTVVSNQPSELSQDLCNAILQQQNDAKRGNILQNVNTGWQSLAPSSAVADYLSHLPTNNLPLSLHHFLKYSAESIKKETQNPLTTIDMSQAQPSQGITLNMISNSNILNQPNIQQQSQHSAQHTLQPQPSHQQSQSQGTTQSQLQPNNNQQQQQAENPAPTTTKSKKKKKKKAPKEKKPRPKPGEIRIKTALDGSPLYCCPECQVAYPERGLLEQHLVGHNLERRFICDICNAALKRKDHLTRHKQSHNPERPFVCTICLKAFKRKEQLSLHFVIHSGEKRHICNECGKGFYRKDHLRKHTRSHIARRVKAELSQNNQPNTGGQTVPQTPSQQSQQSNQSNSQQMQHQQIQSQQQQIPQPQQQHHSQIQQQQSLHLPQQTPSPQNQQSQSGAMIVQ